MNRIAMWASLIFLLVTDLHAAECGLGMLAVKRQETFAFAEKPAVSRDGDKVTIAFKSQAYCDATVAIEDSAGKIIRFLASGVLGPNAPKPFEKNQLKQTLVWDGKNEQGVYVDEKVVVRVSLGLKPRFERTLFWSPAKKVSLYPQTTILRARSDGVYVYDPGLVSPAHAPQLKVFDHDGIYIRTIYPFPAGKVTEVKGLRWEAFLPDGKKFPLKWGTGQLNLLTAGNVGFGGEAWPNTGGEDERRDLVVGEGADGPIYLIGARLNRLTRDGSTPANGLNGPVLETPWLANTRPTKPPHRPNKSKEYCTPTRAALSPDGKWLYLTRYRRSAQWNYDAFLPVVTRLDPNANEPPQVFAGSLKDAESGSGNWQLSVPTDVDCDSQGRVYVADYLNDRIQVFDPRGKHLKSIPVKRPARINVNRRNGEIFVFSWRVDSARLAKSKDWKKSVPARLTHLGPMDRPEQKAVYSMPSKGWMSNTRAEVDFHVKPFAVWLTFGHSGRQGTGTGRDAWRQYAYQNMQVRRLVPKGKELVQVRDFNEDARKAIKQIRPPRHGRQRLYFNPSDGCLYVGEQYYPHPEHIKSFKELIRIDPTTGRCKIVRLPFDAEDMAFDAVGHAYLRTENFVARYDARTWREVPFDYGEERAGVGYHFRGASTVSALVAAGGKGAASSQLGGMGVSPRGDIAVSFFLTGRTKSRKDAANVHASGISSYRPRIFPGRAARWLVHVWDQHGKLVAEDALPGVTRLNDVEVDAKRNVYALTKGHASPAGKLKINPFSMTLIKAKAGAARVLSSKRTPLPLPEAQRPKRKPDLVGSLPGAWDGVKAWVEGADWLYSGAGIDSKHTTCHCEANSQLALDYFGRSFLSEVHRNGVVAVDTNGNTILRMGRYGNVEDGMPLVKEGGPANPRSIGGDEIALISPKFFATDSDRRLFVADIGNQRILSVKLGYHAEEKIALTPGPAGAGTERR